MAAEKVISRSGKVRYASQVRQEKKKAEAIRNEGIDWADWRPKHTKGIFGNITTNPHRHNNERKYL